MSMKNKKRTMLTALLVLIAITQTYVGVSFAALASNADAAAPSVTTAYVNPQQISGILRTQGNKPIMVNGASALTGATILSGATINTPDQVSATVRLPGHATLDIEPNTQMIMNFDQAGNPQVMLIEGCVTLHTIKGTTGEIDTSKGVAGKTDPSKEGAFRVCFPRGATVPTVDGGSVATAGAATGGGGLSTSTKVLIGALIAGGATAAVILVPCHRGRNPSPGEPRGVNDECR